MNKELSDSIVLTGMTNSKEKDFNYLSYSTGIVDSEYFRGGTSESCFIDKKYGWYEKLTKDYFYKPLVGYFTFYKDKNGSYKRSLVRIEDEDGSIICTK